MNLNKVNYNYLSKQTSDIKKNQTEFANYIENKIDGNGKFLTEVKNKTVDLEDRSRRTNLVFYNFAEASYGTSENCDSMVENLLKSLNIFPPGEDIWIERAHRLGRRSFNSATKPRPIIVNFAYYKL